MVSREITKKLLLKLSAMEKKMPDGWHGSLESNMVERSSVLGE